MRKLSNGSGSVYKLSGRRNRPWCIQITTGFSLSDDKKSFKQHRTRIGYYETKQEAMEGLALYLKNPESYKNGSQALTFSQVYNKWYSEKLEIVKTNTAKGYVTAYNTSKTLWEMPFKKITFDHLQGLLNTIESPSTQKQTKNLFAMLWDYGCLHDIVDSNLKSKIEFLKIKPRILKDRERFTNEEVAILWENKEDSLVDIMLMLIYSGLRIDIEFLSLLKKDIDLNERSITIRESKTKSGIRKVPIALKTLPFWEKYYNKAPDPDSKLTGYSYFDCKTGIPEMCMKLLNRRHIPHETRHTTASLLGDNLIDPRIVKIIMGHSTKDDTTLGTYTHFDFKVLLDAIDTI